MLEYHIDTEVSPMRILRIPLQQAIREYPDNKHLLMTYAYLESRQVTSYYVECSKVYIPHFNVFDTLQFKSVEPNFTEVA